MDETISSAGDAEKSPVMKALRLLTHVAGHREPVALAEMARALQLPKPTTFRLAAVLEGAGFLHKDPLTKRYLVGTHFEDVAFSAMRNGAGHGARRLMLDELAERIGARINVAVLKSGKLLLVEWVESSAPLRIDLTPETHIPVHCSASGKLMAAFGSAKLQESFLRAAPYKGLTRKTIVSGKAMARELAEIRRRGFAEDNEEFLAGVNCLAVPVRNAAGDVVATVAAMAPVMLLPLPKLRRHVPELLECATRISEELAASPRTTGRPRKSVAVASEPARAR